MTGRPLTGLSAIVLGFGFNLPYAVLASEFDYPQILRRPAAEVLTRFTEGGPELILAWFAFMTAALALAPLAVALALTPTRLTRSPALAIGTALAGALAGVVQAIGLCRWVFAVPALARNPADPAAQAAFDLLNAFGGVGVGETLGQALTGWFIFQMALLQRREGSRLLAGLGVASALLIGVGAFQGVVIALAANGSPLAVTTIAGFAGLSVWLIATGVLLMRPARRATTASSQPLETL